MTTYHLTHGSYNDYGTYCFIEAPEGSAALIQEVLSKLSKDYKDWERRKYNLTSLYSAEFTVKFGFAPEHLDRFAVVDPTSAAILKIGKKSPHYENAKQQERNFIIARDLREEEFRNHYKAQIAYVEAQLSKSDLGRMPRFEDGISAHGWKRVSISELHVEDPPYLDDN